MSNPTLAETKVVRMPSKKLNMNEDYGYYGRSKMEKTDPRVNYCGAGDDKSGGKNCYSCRFYKFGSCNIVEGTIEAQMCCDLFTKLPQVSLNPEHMASEGDREFDLAEIAATEAGTYRLFNELTEAFAEPPEWIPLMPTPGSYKHPKYGNIKITAERNEKFVKHFQSGKYQEQVPIDLEHETKLSGAAGWIRELRSNSDGSVDAKVEWTDRGEQAIKADRFKYVSPEWYEKWSDPITGETYSDILIGAALTTRPFFKEKALRPLVASEHGFDTPEEEGDAPSMEYREDDLMPADNQTPSGDSIQLSERLALAEAAVEQYRATAEEATQALNEANSRISALEAENRKRQYSDMVTSNNWLGNKDKHVEILLAFAENEGAFDTYVEQQNAIAEQAKTSNLFSESGKTVPQSDNQGSASDRLTALVNKKMSEDKVGYVDALSIVASEHPDLYSEHISVVATRV